MTTLDYIGTGTIVLIVVFCVVAFGVVIYQGRNAPPAPPDFFKVSLYAADGTLIREWIAKGYPWTRQNGHYYFHDENDQYVELPTENTVVEYIGHAKPEAK